MKKIKDKIRLVIDFIQIVLIIGFFVGLFALLWWLDHVRFIF